MHFFWMRNENNVCICLEEIETGQTWFAHLENCKENKLICMFKQHKTHVFLMFSCICIAKTKLQWSLNLFCIYSFALSWRFYHLYIVFKISFLSLPSFSKSSTAEFEVLSTEDRCEISSRLGFTLRALVERDSLGFACGSGKVFQDSWRWMRVLLFVSGRDLWRQTMPKPHG